MKSLSGKTEAATQLWRLLDYKLKERGRGRRLFLAYCVLMVLAYAALAPYMTGPGFSVLGPGDFTAFYTAARIIRSGNIHRLYDLSLQAQVQQKFLLPYGGDFSGGLLPYINPPFLAIIFLPFSFLSLAWAFHAWNAVNLVLLLISIKLLLHYRHQDSRRDLITAGFVALTFFPIVEGLFMGQSTFLVLLTLTLTYLALKSNRDYLAGVTLALGLVKPQLIIMIVAMILYRRRWRTILSFTITSVGLLLCSWMMIGTGGIISYTRLIGRANYGPTLALMPNLRGTAFRFGQFYHAWFETPLSPGAIRAITLVLSAIVLVLTLRTWQGPRNPIAPEFDLRFGQTIIGGLLLSPHLNSYDATLLILVGFFLLNYFGNHAKLAKAHKMIAIGHVAFPLSLATMGAAGQAQVVVLLLVSLMVILQNVVIYDTGTTEIRDQLQEDGYQTQQRLKGKAHRSNGS